MTPKKMLQRLPLVPPKVNVANASKSLLNEIRQIVYSPYWVKIITKKLYNNI